MCGIVGYWDMRGDCPDKRQALKAAVRSLHHRGPDGSGMWINGNGVGLGHTRLSILDLSEAGAQPMLSDDGQLAIVFNGEIYNFRELAEELTSRGHRFASHSDTEVVLAAYREWGADCVTRFIGMFAFAIWDATRKCLRLFRDRAGVKPLYYGWDGTTLRFASELKALRTLPGWEPDIDHTALGEFLQYGYIAAPRTIYSAIRKLPPAHRLDLEIGKVPEIIPYWTLDVAVSAGVLEGDEKILSNELEALLVDAVRYRLVSDVPVGLFLSGGVDSGIVAALLHKIGVHLKVFTIGFESVEHDESLYAARLAQTFGFDHRIMRIGRSDAEAVLAKWPELYDEPFGDNSGIPTHLVAQMAREDVKVALSADGGDELFCGYSGYPLLARRMELHSRLPSTVRGVGGVIGRILTRNVTMNLAGGMAPRLHRGFRGGLVFDRIHKASESISEKASIDAVRPFRTFWQTGEVARLLGKPYRDPRRSSNINKIEMDWDTALEQLTMMDFNEYLADDILVKVDRATMATSLESREPLLDHRIIEFAFRLPIHLKLGPLGNKHILRRILYRNVPRHLVDRPKQGFATPIGKWMEDWLAMGRVSDSIEILSQKMPFLNARWLRGAHIAFAESLQGRNRLWLVHVLGQWAERWL